MKRHILPFGRVGRFFGLVVPVAALVLAGVQLRSGAQPAPGGLPPGAMPGSTTDSMIAKATKDKIKFEGSPACKGGQCHDAGKPVAGSKMAMNENTLWASKDEHSKAYKTLKGGKPERVKRSLEIWAKFNADNKDPAKTPELSQQCLKCHGLVVDKALQGKSFTATEGVTCGSCHGPYEKIHDPHNAVGWADKERAANANDPVKFWDKWGFYDTKDNKARADKCMSCHLAIDAKMVTAGHPQPHFDLYIYSKNGKDDFYPGRHWNQEKGYFGVRLWAIGQGVSLRDALFQLEERATKNEAPETIEAAYKQAMSHFAVFGAAVKASGGDDKNLVGWMAAIKTAQAGKKNADVAKGAKNAASYANTLADGMKAWNPDKASTAKILQGIASTTTTAKELGAIGIEQQGNGIFAVYESLSDTKDAPADSKAVMDMISGTLFPEKFDEAKYSADLAAVLAKLPK